MLELTPRRISTIVESEFPSVYRTEGPMLVALVRAYYEWLESDGQALYHARRLVEYADVDETVDDFLVYIKERYLKGVQLDTATNVRQLVKHSLDLWRSKGTPRAIDLFFRLVYAEGAQVYYPGEDLLRLSSGRWRRPRYLEVTPRAVNASLVGRQVSGVDSGATAFVESLVRRKIGSRYVEVFYVSAISGSFRTGEIVSADGTREGCPVVIGSLTALDVVAGGQEFEVGDRVSLVSSEGGIQGRGRVASVSDETGVVEFELLRGGWGYSANAEVYVSERVLALSGVEVVDGASSYFENFEVVDQPLLTIDYLGATDSFLPGQVLETYHANGDVSGSGVVCAVVESNTTVGTLTVTPTSGDLSANVVFHVQGNTASANSSSVDDDSSYGTVVGVSSNVVVSTVGLDGEFLDDEEVTQVGGSGLEVAHGTVSNTGFVGANGTVSLVLSTGAFSPGRRVVGLTSGASSNVVSVALSVGLVDVSGSFVADDNNAVLGNTGGSTGSVLRVSTGVGAGFQVSNVLSYPETISINTDLLSDYDTVTLNAASYGFPGDPSANVADALEDVLTFANTTVGKLTAVRGVNPGSDYNVAPFVLVVDQVTSGFGRRDQALVLGSSTGTFVEGELVSQVGGGRGLVISANSTYALVERLNFNDLWVVGDQVEGSGSGYSAELLSSSDDPDTTPIGLNAVVQADVQTATGSVVSIEVIDSGFGYVDGETLTFTSADGDRSGSAVAHLRTNGTAEGFYTDRGGHLSSDQRIRDGRYWQEYSYDVRSGLPFDRYADVLRRVLHVAGTAMHGSVVKSSRVTSRSASGAVSVEISYSGVRADSESFGADSDLITADEAG